MSTSATLNVGSYLQIQNKIRITLLSKVATPSKILLKIDAEAIKVIKTPEDADIILHITAYRDHPNALNSETAEVARYILTQRGYDSIPLVTNIEAKIELPKDIAEGITGAVEVGNQLALEHIHQELLSETAPYKYHEGQNPAFQQWFTERITWASTNRNSSAIFKVSQDKRSFSIAGLDRTSLNQLNDAFRDAARYFRSEDSAKQTAPTAFQDVHEAVQVTNIEMIKTIMGRLKPGQNVIYLQVLDPDNGAIAQVHSREIANMTLFVQPHEFDLEQVSFRVKIRLQRSQARTSVAFVTAIYLRPEVLKARAFFEATIARLNRELDQEFKGPIQESVVFIPGRETSDEDRIPVERQLAGIGIPAYQVIPWTEA